MSKKNKKGFFITILVVLVIVGGLSLVLTYSDIQLPIPIFNECDSNITVASCSDDFTIKACTDNKFKYSTCKYGCNEGSCCIADYSDVLVITNRNSKISNDISNYFIAKRYIPVINQLVIDVAESENINFITFNKSVVIPLKNYLSVHSNIKYIVTTKGVPIRVTNTCVNDAGSSLSFDSMLAGLYSESYYGGVHGYGECSGKNTNNYGNYNIVIPVTRLDGYTYDDAIKLITPRVCNNMNGLILLDEKLTGSGAQSLQGDPQLLFAYNYLSTNFPNNAIMLDTTNIFIINKNNIDMYASWGSNDGHITSDSSKWNLSFNPGSISETFVSTSARSFKPGTVYGQSLIADMVHAGISGVDGFTDEPYLSAVADVKKLFSNYLSGKNLAQSFYLAIPYVDWRNIVLGDPKLYVIIGGKKNTCSGIKCSNKCLSNTILSYSGECNGYGNCIYKNMTCINGCNIDRCNTPVATCTLTYASTCYSKDSELVKTWCIQNTYYNGVEYVSYLNAVNPYTYTGSNKWLFSNYNYCIDGVSHSISSSSLVFNNTLLENGNLYLFSGSWNNTNNIKDNNPLTYTQANTDAAIYINYTFIQKIVSIKWKVYYSGGSYVFTFGPFSPKTMGLNTIQLRIYVKNSKTYYGWYNGTAWVDWKLVFGDAPFNMNTNKEYDEEIVGIYTADCYPNTKICQNGKLYICDADFKNKEIGVC